MPSDNLKNYRVEKVVLNIGVGEGAYDKRAIESASADLMAISGQKPVIRRAKKAVSGFKIKKGDIVGLEVTLRRKRMRDFLAKLFAIVLPRLKDFQGVSLRGFDGQGNYSLGVSEQIVFPEIDYSKVNKIRGLGITIVTNARADEKAKELLESMGMPFEKIQNPK